MKLSLLKCAFSVSLGKFLGFMVNQQGIEANPEKIQTFLNMKSTTKPKEVQRLTRKVATLSRFVSRAMDKCLPLFDALKGTGKFEWTER